MAIRVGEIRGKAHVDPHDTARGHMDDLAFRVNDKLGVVPIRSAQQAHPLDLVTGEGG